MVARDWEAGDQKGEGLLVGTGLLFWGDANVLESDSGIDCTFL